MRQKEFKRLTKMLDNLSPIQLRAVSQRVDELNGKQGRLNAIGAMASDLTTSSGSITHHSRNARLGSLFAVPH